MVVAFTIEKQLTPPEARIVARLARGSTRSTLAVDIGLSKDTVKSQVRNLCAKFDVGSTDELIAALLKRLSSVTVA